MTGTNSKTRLATASLIIIAGIYGIVSFRDNGIESQKTCKETVRKIQLQREKEHLELYGSNKLSQIYSNCISQPF